MEKMKFYLVAVPEGTAVEERIREMLPRAAVRDVSGSAVARQLEHDLVGELMQGDGIQVRVLGDFHMTVDGKPIRFERGKARELMALLVEHRGEPMTTRQIAAELWEDTEYDSRVKNQVTRTVSSLKRTLEQAGADEILVKSWNCLAIDPELIKFES